MKVHFDIDEPYAGVKLVHGIANLVRDSKAPFGIGFSERDEGRNTLAVDDLPTDARLTLVTFPSKGVARGYREALRHYGPHVMSVEDPTGHVLLLKDENEAPVADGEDIDGRIALKDVSGSYATMKLNVAARMPKPNDDRTFVDEQLKQWSPLLNNAMHFAFRDDDPDVTVTVGTAPHNPNMRALIYENEFHRGICVMDCAMLLWDRNLKAGTNITIRPGDGGGYVIKVSVPSPTEGVFGRWHQIIAHTALGYWADKLIPGENWSFTPEMSAFFTEDLTATSDELPAEAIRHLLQGVRRVEAALENIREILKTRHFELAVMTQPDTMKPVLEMRRTGNAIHVSKEAIERLEAARMIIWQPLGDTFMASLNGNGKRVADEYAEAVRDGRVERAAEGEKLRFDVAAVLARVALGQDQICVPPRDDDAPQYWLANDLFDGNRKRKKQVATEDLLPREPYDKLLKARYFRSTGSPFEGTKNIPCQLTAKGMSNFFLPKRLYVTEPEVAEDEIQATAPVMGL